MQTRKRAKPVKFGKTSHPAEVKEVMQKAEEEQMQEELHEEKETSPAESLPTDEKEEEPWRTVISTTQTSIETSQSEAPTETATELEVAPEQDEEEAPVEKKEEKPSIDDQWPFPVEKEKKHGLFTYFLLVTLIAFLLGLSFIAGIYYTLHGRDIHLPFVSRFFNTTVPLPAASPTSTVNPVSSPTPTASTSANLSQYTVSVLNGSGIAGKAAKVKSTLVSQGYNVTATGNADKNTYTTTQITAKKSVDTAFLNALKTALQKDYVVEIESPVSSTAQSADVVVIIGTTPSQ